MRYVKDTDEPPLRSMTVLEATFRMKSAIEALTR
jgi:hypothetical protein